jgi:uncharacterized lipoprotein YddW (UPF0748 family)
MDYCVPQIYWEIGNKAADYETLIRWWNQYAGKRPLFIGEDIERTVKNADKANPSKHQQDAKFKLHNELQNVNGTVLWYAKMAVDNPGNYSTILRKKYWSHPSLQPSMTFIDKTAPAKPRKMKAVWTSDGYMLFWTAPKCKNWTNEATQYAIYCFEKGEKVNINDATKIVAVTGKTYYKLPYENGKTKHTYVVTALNRLSNESKIVKKKVKL